MLSKSVGSDGECVFNASGTSQPEVQFSPDSGTISVQGFVLSAIETVSDLGKLTEDLPPTLYSSWQEILETVPDPYHTEEPH